MIEQTVEILFVDDDEDDFVLVRELLADIAATRFRVEWVQDYDRALERLQEQAWDACLVDFRLGERDGISLIREAREAGVELPIILLTGQGDHEVDVAAMKAGAADFLDKSQLTADALERALRYAMHAHAAETQRRQLLRVAEQQATQLRHLATELTQAEQRERRRVAQTLHDHLQQLLVAAKMRVDRLQSLSEDEELRKAVAQVDDLLSDSIEASRSLTVQLSPPVLHDRGLIPALEWLSRQFETEQDLTVELVGDEEIEIADDNIRDFLFQAVRELLFNVVKHAGVRKAQVEATLTELGDVRVTVRDQGQGCDPETVLNPPTHEGFGLFHLQQRVQFLGGSFVVDSAPGAGCAISTTVPLQVAPSVRPRPQQQPASGPARAARREEPAPPPSDAIRVLLVDDHKILREGIAGLLLDQPGINVVGEASDGQMAVDLSRELQPDVVIMDVSMPVLSGIDATRIIRREFPQIQVIGLSMHEKEDMSNAMSEAGAAAYLPKGGPSEDLINAIFSIVHAARSRPNASPMG